MKRIAVYPGSFDPITNGHFDIIEKASKLFDEVHVIICINKSKNSSLFSITERLEMLNLVTQNLSNIVVDFHEGLAVEYAKKVGATSLIKGVRNAKDFDYELTQYHFNKHINPELETVVLLPNLENLFVSSSAIKELMSFNADYTNYVPKEILHIIKAKEK